MNRILQALLAVLLLQFQASACTSCFGAAGDQATHGLNMAILTLLGVMSTIVVAAMACIAYIILQAQAAEAAQDEELPGCVPAMEDPC